MPENSFYNQITLSMGIGKSKLKKNVELETENNKEKRGESIHLPVREWEKIIFAKSMNPAPDINLNESLWCQRYLTFIKTKHELSRKIKEEGHIALSVKEKRWLEKYEHWKRISKLSLKKKAVTEEVNDVSLLRRFYNSEYRNSCTPMKVIYPETEKISNTNLKSIEQ